MKSKASIIRVIGLTALLFQSAVVQASEKVSARGGSEAGGGGSMIARHLESARTLIIEQLPNISPEKDPFKDESALKELYKDVYSKLGQDLRLMEFRQVPESTVLTDPHFGYKTWIRIVNQSPILIEYNPSVEQYLSLVETSPAASVSDNKAPRLYDVLQFVLHELGHHYGLTEEMAWTFALKLSKGIALSKGNPSQSCKFYIINEVTGTQYREEFGIKIGDKPKKIRFYELEFIFGLDLTLSLDIINANMGRDLQYLEVASNSELHLESFWPNGFSSVTCKPQ